MYLNLSFPFRKMSTNRTEGWVFILENLALGFCLWEKMIVKLHHAKCMEYDNFSFFFFLWDLYFIPVPAVFHLWENLYRNCSLSTSLWKDKVERIGVSAMKIRKSLLIIVHLQAPTRKENFIAVGSGHILFWDLMVSMNYSSNMYSLFLFKTLAFQWLNCSYSCTWHHDFSQKSHKLNCMWRL